MKSSIEKNYNKITHKVEDQATNTSVTCIQTNINFEQTATNGSLISKFSIDPTFESEGTSLYTQEGNDLSRISNSKDSSVISTNYDNSGVSEIATISVLQGYITNEVTNTNSTSTIYSDSNSTINTVNSGSDTSTLTTRPYEISITSSNGIANSQTVYDSTKIENSVEGSSTARSKVEITDSSITNSIIDGATTSVINQNKNRTLFSKPISVNGEPDSGFLFMTQAEGGISNWRNKTASNTATNSAGFNSQRSRGTLASPLAILAGDRIGVYSHGGYTGTLFNNAARFITSAEENWSSTANGARLSIEVTKTGTTSDYEAFRLTGQGLNIYGNGIYDPTNSFATSTKLTTDVLKASNSISAYRFAGGTTIRGVRYNGTPGSETAMTQYDQIIVFGASGYDGTNTPTLNGGLYYFASENWTTSAKGTQIKLRGTKNGTSASTTFAHFDGRGRMAIGGNINADSPTINAYVDIKTDETVNNALQVSNSSGTPLLNVNNNGEVSIGGNIQNINNVITSANTLTFTAEHQVTYITFTGTTSTFTLPPVINNTGKRFVIINSGSGNITLNSNSGSNEIWEGGSLSNNTIITPGTVYQIYNNSVSYINL